ncbi:MAG TPA: hypothetical protein VMV80_06405 [Anaerolineales bacterium]|nr:hypothetical protein [Anaerolineales bacterium]
MKIYRYLVLLLFFIVGTYLVYIYLPVDAAGPRSDLPAIGLNWNDLPQLGTDWRFAFQPALLQFPDVYSGSSLIYNPPWALLPLLPVALLSPGLGTAVMFVLNLLCWAYVVYRFRLSPIYFVVFLLFSNVIINCWNGNIEGLVALGLILPQPIGILFLLAKPQFGGAVVLYWVVDAWRSRGFQAATRLVLPAVIAILVSLFLFGPWAAHGASLPDKDWNVSVFPWGVPAGVILLGLSIWRRDIRFAMMASPFFSPYLARYTWSIVWFGALLFVPRFDTLYRRITHGRYA